MYMMDAYGMEQEMKEIVSFFFLILIGKKNVMTKRTKNITSIGINVISGFGNV